jgi:hypothetical protein
LDALNVAALGREKKMEEAILRGLRLLPADLGAQLKSMLSPQSLAIVVAGLVGLAVAQAFGIGELIDALVLIAEIGFCGWGAVDGCRDLLQSIRTALNARTERDLDKAGRYFASAVTKIGGSAQKTAPLLSRSGRIQCQRGQATLSGRWPCVCSGQSSSDRIQTCTK